MGGKRSKGAKRKCRNCGAFNELNARYCCHCANTLTGSLPERAKKKAAARGREPSYWVIGGVIALIFLVGLAVKMVLYRGPDIPEGEKVHKVPLLADDSMERQIQLVASNFRCACGGCGELPLIECNCDMPRGALEEKGFIREKLKEGLTIDQVIQWVEREYGLRIAG
jgi:cytochrome c-type biogenesis protein CcmH/NrfF